MTKRIKIIIVSIITLGIIGIGVGIYFSTERLADTPDVEVEETPMFTSMEDGEVINQSDIEGRVSIEEFARQAALDYFKREFPESTSITVQSTEWYFTDENDSDNLLVRVNIVDESRTLRKYMRVIEIDTDADSSHVVVSTFEPDERYSL